MIKRGNKKAQELSLNTIILIILGVIVLVLLIFGFTVGWERLKGIFFPSNNVADVVSKCGQFCSLSQSYDYCSSPRELNNGTNKFSDVTCYALSIDDSLKRYQIAECPAVNCKATVNCADMKYLAGKTSTNVKVTVGGSVTDLTGDTSGTYCLKP